LKVILNKATTYQNRILAYGDTADVELKVADRWIRLGLAHLPEEVKTEPVKIPVKSFDEYIKGIIPQITYEDLDGIASYIPKEKVVDIDIIEPVPVDKYVSFDEHKEVKIIKKANKK